MTNDEMVGLHVQLPRDLWHELRIRVACENTTMRAIVTEMIVDRLAQDCRKPR